MKKSILVISQYFWPEKFHINDVCEELHKLGHNIQILTGKPNYPTGKIFKGYKKKKVNIEKFKGLKIYRVPLSPRKKSTKFDLISNYLSFIFNGTFYGSRFKYDKFDKIFFYGTSPILSAIPAIIIKLIYRKKLIIWLQDLWPQSLTATGYINNKLILKIINCIVIIIYSFADKILIQSKMFKKYLIKQTSKKKIIYHPNSFKTPTLKIKLNSNHKKLLKQNTCITFAGNIGKAQNLEYLILATKNLSKLSKLKILIIGEGSDKNRLIRIVNDNKLKNIHFLGALPQNYVYEIYKHSKAAYVSLKDSEVLNLTLPYKIQSYLSAGKLIIGSVSGITKEIITKNYLGFCCKNSDTKKLEKIISKVYFLKNNELNKIQKNSETYFKKNYVFAKTIKKLSQILND
jgi:glycosyltransferase involved in cell wall biosynthesis